MKREDIITELYKRQDKEYGAFQSGLLPSVDADAMIGVRTPALRDMAKKRKKDEDVREFLEMLPHQYFEENQLHAFIISLEKDFDTCVKDVEAFLPFVDNWATCDQMSPKVFQKEAEKLLPYIRKWMDSDKTYTVRFAIGMLMQHYLEDDFCPDYLEMVASVRSEEYYVQMMVAWYFATALAKQYENALPYLQEKRLDDWTHNKTIQKAVESFRITPKQKQYLRTLKVKKSKKS